MAEESPELSESVMLCRGKSAAQRMRGIASLGAKGEAAAGAVPVLAELFGDPDPRVRTASRKAAIQILTPAKIPGLRFQ
jgi:HEAT repeat protein